MKDKICCSREVFDYPNSPKKIVFSVIDYFKALYSWFFAFKRTFIIEPGLYFTGENYDINSPFLVTCNYHMTVFMLFRVLKGRNTRILVIDTEGINVWCSSGKGKFSAAEILKQLNRYDRSILTKTGGISLVLPKLSFSGVSINELKRNSIDPIIGPIYAKKLPAYLDDLPLKNRINDVFMFSLKDRLFTLIPSLAQLLKYGLYISAALFVWHYYYGTDIYWQVMPIFFIIVSSYVIFFPALPTKKFCVKGLFLYGILLLFLSGYFIFNIFNNGKDLDLLSFIFYVFFLGGSTLFFSLSYTGNSGVSNYSLVKKEVVAYLPYTILFFAASLVTIIYMGVSK